MSDRRQVGEGTSGHASGENVDPARRVDDARPSRQADDAARAGRHDELRGSDHPELAAAPDASVRRDERAEHGEPERYELSEGPAYRFNPDRRQFLKLFGGGIAVACLSGGAVTLAKHVVPEEAAGTLPGDSIGAWLHVDEDGSVTVYTGKVEVGQNIRTSLAQAVAEELRVPVEAIGMVMGDTDLTPFDRGTFGSLTTPQMAPQLRRAAAAAREMLIDLAAASWNVDRRTLAARDGAVVDPSNGRSLDFGRLTRGRKLVEAIPSSVPQTDEWRVMGTSVPRVDGRAFVTGAHTYVSDMKLPGMWIGKVLRPPSFGATLAALDASRAEAMADVVVVRDGDFAGVAAPDERTAFHALTALRAEWTTSPQPSQRELFDYLRRNASNARPAHAAGNAEAGFAAAHVTLEDTYTVDYIAHVPPEPRAAVARWEDGRLTVWTGTQRPFGVRTELADAFRIPEERVRVIMPDTGSAYGGKHTGETAVEAARLARAAGRPVKLVWTREEEFTWAYFRPAGVIDVRSGIDRDGTVTAWTFDNYNSGTSGIRTPYEVANQRITFHPTRSPLRQGSYRALASTANNFARESHMDDLAHAASMDPLAFRLKNLRNDRLRAVFEAAASAFGWGGAGRRDLRAPAGPDASSAFGRGGATREPGRGFGIAGGIEKGGYVATCAEVAVDSRGEVRIVRVVAAFECGAVVNPEHLKNQIEGCIVQGIGGALFESIRFENGRITNPAFSRYRVPRFSDTPPIEVVLVDRKDLPAAGAGETPIIGIAPAVGNAIFDATGIRLRSLPMAPNGVGA